MPPLASSSSVPLSPLLPLYRLHLHLATAFFVPSLFSHAGRKRYRRDFPKSRRRIKRFVLQRIFLQFHLFIRSRTMSFRISLRLLVDIESSYCRWQNCNMTFVCASTNRTGNRLISVEKITFDFVFIPCVSVCFCTRIFSNISAWKYRSEIERDIDRKDKV